MNALERIEPIPAARPGYLEPWTEPQFNVRITRLGGDTGTPIPKVGGEWHVNSRHRYSRIPIRNRTGSLAFLEQKYASEHSRPSKLIVDGKTWAPIVANKFAVTTSRFLAETSDARWAPWADDVLIATTKTAELVAFDVLRDAEVWRIPHGLAGGDWTNEGCPSRDGSVCVMGVEGSNRIKLVDLANGRVGEEFLVDLLGQPLGNVTVSLLATNAGGKVIAKASGSNEYGRVFDFDERLRLTPHEMHRDGLRSGASKDRTDGFVMMLSHADRALTFAGGEVWVGGVRGADDTNWSGRYVKDRDGRIVAIELETGLHTCISPGSAMLGEKSAGDEHCSGEVEGFVCASMYRSGGVYAAEILVLPLDVVREVEGQRFAAQVPVMRFPSYATGSTYTGEVQARQITPTAIVFASDWSGRGASPAFGVGECKAYLAERLDAEPLPPADDDAFEEFALNVPYAIRHKANGLLVHPRDNVRMLNEWARDRRAK